LKGKESSNIKVDKAWTLVTARILTLVQTIKILMVSFYHALQNPV